MDESHSNIFNSWDGVCLMYCNIKPSRMLFNGTLWLPSAPNIWSWGNSAWTFGDGWKSCWRVVVLYVPFISANMVWTWSKHCSTNFFISPSPSFMSTRPCLSCASVLMIDWSISASQGMMVDTVQGTDLTGEMAVGVRCEVDAAGISTYTYISECQCKA